MERSLNEVMKFSHNTAVMQMYVINFLSSLPALVSFIRVAEQQK
jgi:hypothetical protein